MIANGTFPMSVSSGSKKLEKRNLQKRRNKKNPVIFTLDFISRSGEPCLQVGEATLTREGSVSGGSAKTPFKTSGSWSCCDWSGRADVLLQTSNGSTLDGPIVLCSRTPSTHLRCLRPPNLLEMWS
ncbi:uncharacterized protein LOC105071405 isoform X1 [Camelus bactrianus]|uniref:Uncharacterized protein LOC105071405 isoform X1 n=8 Tax=Camelus bactrianus TaxID=9837 RepID=A0AC58PF03_CAMBA